ncbi:MAG: phospholipase D-like domain-containing protein [Candidatus Babeliales bacterium]|jgi:phosphatidylserine/phosphatidylglycerophosphate/cardiolipin synthase-like enzyme
MRSIVIVLVVVGAIFGATYGVTEVFFAPDDRPATRLVELIDSAHKKIYAAIYMITDQKIAQALVRARKRGVEVQIIVDTSSMVSSYGKGQQLKAGNIDLYVFGGDSSHHSFRQPLMHNKFAIIDNKVWTGSFNWTKSANEKNQENVILTDNADVRIRFERHFQRLKERCHHYAACPQPSQKEPTVWWQDLWTSSVIKVCSFFSYIKDDIRKTMPRV